MKNCEKTFNKRRATSIQQLECLKTFVLHTVDISPSKLGYRLIFSAGKLQCRPTSIVLKFIFKLIGTYKTFLAKRDFCSI